MSGEEKHQCVISRSSSSPTLCKIIMWDSRIVGDNVSTQPTADAQAQLHSSQSLVWDAEQIMLLSEAEST